MTPAICRSLHKPFRYIGIDRTWADEEASLAAGKLSALDDRRLLTVSSALAKLIAEPCLEEPSEPPPQRVIPIVWPTLRQIRFRVQLTTQLSDLTL